MIKIIKLFICVFACAICTGCPSLNKSNSRAMSISDNSLGLVEFGADKKLSKRLGLRVNYSQVQMNDSDLLDQQEYTYKNGEVSNEIAVVRLGSNFWEYPNTINYALKNSVAKLELFFLPLNNQNIEIKVGGGIVSQNAELTISPNPTQSASTSNIGITVFTEARYKITPKVHVKLGIDSFLASDVKNQHIAKIGISWLPVKFIATSVGYSGVTSSYEREGYDIHAGYVDPNSSLDEPCTYSISEGQMAGRSCLYDYKYFTHQISGVPATNSFDAGGNGPFGSITLSF